MTAAKATKMVRQVTQMQYMTTEHLSRADARPLRPWGWLPRRRRRLLSDGGGKSFPHLLHAPLSSVPVVPSLAMATGSSLSRKTRQENKGKRSGWHAVASRDLVGRRDSETCQILQLSLTFFPFFSAHSKTSSISSQSGESPRPLRMRSQAKWTKEGEREREREEPLRLPPFAASSIILRKRRSQEQKRRGQIPSVGREIASAQDILADTAVRSLNSGNWASRLRRLSTSYSPRAL